MSAAYRAIQLTPYKRRYDLAALVLVFSYLATFYLIGKLRWRDPHTISDEVLLMRALGTCAFILLTLILSIGPLCRLDRRFLPLLYNRRHLGVITFFVALFHAALAIGFYHGFGRITPLLSLLTSNTQFRSISGFPFEILGLAVLLILFLMASTSHDFWLRALTPGTWKALHMLVYPAWALLVAHILFGAVQSEPNPLYVALLAIVIIALPTLHIIAGLRELRRDRSTHDSDWIDAGPVEVIPENHGKVLCTRNRERIALFRYGTNLAAIGNICAHQGGPLGEGKIIDGCVTCPWHGYQYRPQDGRAPPPFDEKVPKYAIRITNQRVHVSTSEQHDVAVALT